MSGYIKHWDMRQISNQLRSAAYTCSDPYQDGFSTWPIKQELYQLKWLLDDLIRQCPTYVDEQSWLQEQEHQRIIGILKSEL